VTPGLSWRVLHVVADRLVSMDVRLAIAAMDQFQRAGVRLPVTAFCAEHGISRKAFYEVRKRYRTEGLEGLVPRSRRPRSSPSATSPAMVGLVVAKRLALIADGRDEGAQSIRWSLEDDGHSPPSVRTIHRILVAHSLVAPQPQKRPRSSFKRFASPWANGCWQLDGHERLLLDGSTVVVLRVQDDCSRRILASRAAVSENTHDAWECVKTAIAKHGAPAMFLTDNGSALSQRRAKGVMSEFEARLRGEGILPVTSSVSRPQTCGKKEREWETLDKWLAVRPDPANLGELQLQLDAYDLMFNHERRHQALDGRTPAH
jgi:transposase InsO family protein